MTFSQALPWFPPEVHDSRHEGVTLGLTLATATWLWVALIDVVSGHPFHTFEVLGGVGGFTMMHFALNVTFGYVLVSAVHGAARTPSLVFALIFCGIIFEGATAMVTALIAEAAVGRVAWFGLFGGSLVSAVIAVFILSRTHPLADYLKQAEEER